MLVHHHSTGQQVRIAYGIAGYKIIVIYLAVVNTLIFVKISFTDAQNVMGVRNNIFDLICFIFKESRSSIPVDKFDPSVASVTISVPGITNAIRQDGGLVWHGSYYQAFVQVATLNPSQSSSRVNSKDIR